MDATHQTRLGDFVVEESSGWMPIFTSEFFGRKTHVALLDATGDKHGFALCAVQRRYPVNGGGNPTLNGGVAALPEETRLA
jgi:hypothetical protein